MGGVLHHPSNPKRRGPKQQHQAGGYPQSDLHATSYRWARAWLVDITRLLFFFFEYVEPVVESSYSGKYHERAVRQEG